MNLKREAVLRMALLLSIALTAAVLAYGIIGKKREEARRPAAVSAAVTGTPRSGPPSISRPQPQPTIIPVYLSKEKRVDRISLENYIQGVIAAEMPVDFEPEALKAQAMAARTYIVRRIADHDFSGVPVKDAWVTDTVQHQAYLPDAVLRERWKDRYEENAGKIKRAVDETRGLILTYQKRPIMSAFFSTSNGYTENSEEYWADSIPYLRSVPSPWDKAVSPEFIQRVDMPIKEFASRLGIRRSNAVSAAEGAKVLKTSEGHRIKEIRVDGKLFTGREVREKLNLPSSQFEWKLKGGNVEITSYGYGHGVGMSQWGAQGMAKEGKTAQEIVQYYYKDIEIQEDTDYILPVLSY